MDLKQNDRVRWREVGGLPSGSGIVKGFASIELAVIGRNVIIEVTDASTLEAMKRMGYYFDHICLFESGLEKD